MATVFSLVRAYVLGDTAVAALIGGRFYPIKAPQGATYPLVTMQLITGLRPWHMRGPGSVEESHYQIDAWMKDTGSAFERATDLGELIRQRMDGYAGILTDSSVSPTESYQVDMHFESARDLFEQDISGGYYRHVGEYLIGHRPVTS